MDLTTIKIIGGPRVVVTVDDIDRAATKLGARFPRGYCEYVMTLGEGTLSDFVRVYPPWRIVAEFEEWRDRIRQYWFWEDGTGVLTDERAEESIIVADTLNGDELVFHPSEPDRLFVLPRNDDVIFEAGNGLIEAVEWLCSSGKLTRRIKTRQFEPFDSRTVERDQPITSAQPARPRKQTSNIDLAGKSPDQVLQQFFLALEDWEEDAYKAMSNAPTDENGDLGEDKFYEIRASVAAAFSETVEPFVSETFDIGKPSSYGSPAHYGRTGPRIVDAKISGDTADIMTRGHNMYPSETPSYLFRLVRQGNSWRVDSMWEITKSGRRKRVKLFL